MTKGGQFVTATVAALMAFAGMAGKAGAAQCGNGPGGFAAWKQQFANEARARGISASTVAALLATNYSTATINADRGQHGFHSSLEQFLARRGGSAIVARGRALKQSNAGLSPPSSNATASRRGRSSPFGVWRRVLGVLAAVITRCRLWRIADDCRRTAYFTDQLYAALTLVDRGILSPATRGSMHGEVGQTQFLPKNILEYGAGGSLNSAASALSSTANFLRAHGWQAGAGYQPGEANFGAIQAWNAAPVYQQGDRARRRNRSTEEGDADRAAPNQYPGVARQAPASLCLALGYIRYCG